MNSKKTKILITVVSIIVLIFSLTQNAIKVNFNDEIKMMPSLDYFLMGAIAFLGGGLFEEIIWLANPLSLFAIILLFKNNKDAVLLSLLALGLSVSFFFWKEILGSESGSRAKIISFELGYYLWVLSIFILTISVFIYFKKSKTVLQS